MGKKLKYTPRSRIRAALRQLWLRSRERASALKRDKYTCQVCGKKQTMAKGKVFKVQVHHINGIKWDYLIDEMYKHLLCNPNDLQTICKPCHTKAETDERRNAEVPG